MSRQDAFRKVGMLKKRKPFAFFRAYADDRKINLGSHYLLKEHRWHAPSLHHPEFASVAHLYSGAHLEHLRGVLQQRIGQTSTPRTTIQVVDPAFSARVGAAYDALPDWSADALTAYQALNDEVTTQADLLEKHGYSFSLYGRDGEPYASSTELRNELHGSKHITIFTPTTISRGDFFQHHYKLEGGVNVPLVKQPNPLLQWDVKRSTPERPVLKTDLFRFVQDAFGHGILPHQFGPLGEDNAYREHMTMFSPLAQRALTTETRGQNSWVNFGPHMRRPDGSFPRNGDPDFVQAAHRAFAAQKIALLPEWAADLTVGKGAYPSTEISAVSGGNLQDEYAGCDVRTHHRNGRQERRWLIVDDGYADIAYRDPVGSKRRRTLGKLPGDSVSYIRFPEMKAYFWHDGSLWWYNKTTEKLEWARDMPEEDLSQDEKNALNKRRRYFGIPAP